MSKNVNPNHDKVADRERQGEDIAQARNTQKHAESLARRRGEAGAAYQPPSLAQRPAPRGTAQTRAAKAAMRNPLANPVKAPPGQTRGRNLVPGSSGRHASVPKAVAGAFGKEPSPRRRPTRKG